jgi:hypothetical protein
MRSIKRCEAEAHQHQSACGRTVCLKKEVAAAVRVIAAVKKRGGTK